MFIKAALLASVAFLFSAFGQAEGAVDSKANLVMCRSQKVIRTIRVTADSDGCQAVYTKAGVDRVVGNAKNKQSCMQVVQNIRRNLEGAAWRCKDVSTATYTEIKN